MDTHHSLRAPAYHQQFPKDPADQLSNNNRQRSMSLGIVEESPVKNDLAGYNRRGNLANLFANDCSRIERKSSFHNNYAQEPQIAGNSRVHSDRKPPTETNFSNEYLLHNTYHNQEGSPTT